jgi:hypothetical protein
VSQAAVLAVVHAVEGDVVSEKLEPPAEGVTVAAEPDKLVAPYRAWVMKNTATRG